MNLLHLSENQIQSNTHTHMTTGTLGSHSDEENDYLL